MKLLIDMNMFPKWVGVLRDAGFEAVHWSSISKAKSPDADIIKFARRESYVILTEDLDFGTMLTRTTISGPAWFS